MPDHDANARRESSTPGAGTRCVHGGQRPDPGTGAVMPPIVTASTFAQDAPNSTPAGYEYSRAGNPTRGALERLVATLEGSGIPESVDDSRGGFAFASGMAAMAAAMDLVDAGAHVIAMDDLYGGSGRLLRMVRQRAQGLDLSFVDLADAEAFGAAMRPETALVWVETPTNPLMKLCDLARVAEIARSINPGVLLCCDNTFATPINQRPLELGFDVAAHSTTKYMNGHSDSIGGVLVTNRPELAERIRFIQKSVGAILSPFDSYLTLRGVKTLQLRMERHNASGLAMARHLEAHPRVQRVLYPGLDSHPQAALARRQMDGCTGMVSVVLEGGVEEATRVLQHCRVFALAESLGGVESLIEHPALMTHASVPADVREQLGIGDSLIRLSCGIEDIDDLVADIDQAIELAYSGVRAPARNPASRHAPC